MLKNSRVHVLSSLLVFLLFLASGYGCDVADVYDWYCPQVKHLCESDGWVQSNCATTCCNGAVVITWTACSKTCGMGTQYKEDCSSGSCRREYRACNTAKCPLASCYLQSKTNKYGIGHACCAKEKQSFGSWCGVNSLNLRVTGGKNSKHKQWPWMVAIDMKKSVRQLCAGTLISKKFVISAAHCFTKDDGTAYDYNRWILYFGILRLQDYKSAKEKSIKTVTIHPQFDFPKHDIAIIELKSAVAYSSTIKPICLPGGETPPKDTTCFVTGWGTSNVFLSSTTDHLQEAPINTFDPEVCKSTFRKLSHMSSVMPFVNGGTGYICAGSLHEAIDSCDGDSGGPLVCQRCESCRFYLAGVVSVGNPYCEVIGYPALYTKVSDYETWINQVTGVSQSLHTCYQSVGP